MSNLGKTADALAFYRRALELDQELVKNAPRSREARKELYSALIELGQVELQMGRGETAQELFRQGLDAIETLSLANPNNTQDRAEIADVCVKIGYQLVNDGKAAEAVPYFKRAAATLTPLVAADPKDTLYRRDLSVTEGHVASECAPAATRRRLCPMLVKRWISSKKCRGQIPRMPNSVPT